MVKRFLPYLFPLITALLLAVLESDVLYALQDQNLFLHTPLFFKQQMVRAGGLLTWAGCYLTQYFYYPMLGAGILCLLWAFFMWLTKRAFRLENLWLTLIPTTCLVLTIVTLGYWIYYLKLPGKAFDTTIGAIVTVALVWGYRALPRRHHLPSIYIVFAAGLGYVAFGFYALLASALMGIISWRDEKRWDDSFLALTQIILWPILGYFRYFHETNIVNIYWTALPVFVHQGERYVTYSLPYIVLFASMVLMALKPNIKSAKWLNIGIVVTVMSLFVFWNRDENLHLEINMARNVEKGQWDEVLQTAKDVKGEPTRLICMMRNLALFEKGQPFTKIADYPEGARRPAAPFVVHTVHTAGKQLYLHYGIPNYCYRWCMEDGVEYGWSVEKLKLMALCSIVNSEFVAAQRYVNLLKKTDFHKSWAKHIETYIQNPRLVVKAPEFQHILPLLREDNFLTADQSQQEMFLIEQLLSTNGDTQEQTRLAEFTVGYYRNNHKKLVEE